MFLREPGQGARGATPPSSFLFFSIPGPGCSPGGRRPRRPPPTRAPFSATFLSNHTQCPPRRPLMVRPAEGIRDCCPVRGTLAFSSMMPRNDRPRGVITLSLWVYRFSTMPDSGVYPHSVHILHDSKVTRLQLSPAARCDPPPHLPHHLMAPMG